MMHHSMDIWLTSIIPMYVYLIKKPVVVEAQLVMY